MNTHSTDHEFMNQRAESPRLSHIGMSIHPKVSNAGTSDRGWSVFSMTLLLGYVCRRLREPGAASQLRSVRVYLWWGLADVGILLAMSFNAVFTNEMASYDVASNTSSNICR